MQRPMTVGMIACTQDQWADRMSDVRTYQTEYIRGDYSIMYSRLSETGSPVGEVHYLPDGTREYFTWPI